MTFAIFAHCSSMISLRMNVSVLIAAVTEAPLIGVLLTTDITHLVTKKKKKKKISLARNGTLEQCAIN